MRQDAGNGKGAAAGGRGGAASTLLSRVEPRGGGGEGGGDIQRVGKGQEEENLVALALLSGGAVCFTGLAFALLVSVIRR